MYIFYPSNSELTFLEQSILRLSDLSTISAKRIRHALAQEYPNDEIARNKVFRIVARENTDIQVNSRSTNTRMLQDN